MAAMSSRDNWISGSFAAGEQAGCAGGVSKESTAQRSVPRFIVISMIE